MQIEIKNKKKKKKKKQVDLLYEMQIYKCKYIMIYQTWRKRPSKSVRI